MDDSSSEDHALADDDEVATLASLSTARGRAEKTPHPRVDWEAHVKLLLDTGGFEKRCHMTLPTFQKLVSILRHKVAPDAKQSVRSAGIGPITADVVASGLRCMGGSVHKDIADMFGFHEKSSERVVKKFLDTVGSSLRTSVPTGSQESEETADGWDKTSGAQGLFRGAVAPIDGWLCCTDRPSVPNALDYRSGHAPHQKWLLFSFVEKCQMW